MSLLKYKRASSPALSIATVAYLGIRHLHSSRAFKLVPTLAFNAPAQHAGVVDDTDEVLALAVPALQHEGFVWVEDLTFWSFAHNTLLYGSIAYSPAGSLIPFSLNAFHLMMQESHSPQKGFVPL